MLPTAPPAQIQEAPGQPYLDRVFQAIREGPSVPIANKDVHPALGSLDAGLPSVHPLRHGLGG